MMTAENNNMSLKIAELAKKARDGNRMSFQELVSMFQEDIHRLAYYRTFSQMDAEDITQEVFVQAYRKLKSLNDTRKFRAWLYSIAVNRCNDFLRKRKFLSLLQLRSTEENVYMKENQGMNSSYEDSIAKKRFWEQVRTLLGNFSAMEREVFTLRFMDHQNIKEISAILDKSESTVKTHLYRALNKARKDSVFFQDYRELLS